MGCGIGTVSHGDQHIIDIHTNIINNNEKTNPNKDTKEIANINVTNTNTHTSMNKGSKDSPNLSRENEETNIQSNVQPSMNKENTNINSNSGNISNTNTHTAPQQTNTTNSTNEQLSDSVWFYEENNVIGMLQTGEDGVSALGKVFV
jgi:hypothetical protein